MKTAVVYARVSTVRQADDELPIQSQIQQCIAKAEALDATVLRVFSDEGVSGRRDNRPKFQDSIEFCDVNDIDYFVTWSTSRFARNKLDAALYKMRLAKSGTEIVYVSVAIDRNSDGGWVTEGVMELFDEFYSRQIAADTRRSMIKNARDGYWNGGRAPYGYRPEPAPDNLKRKKLIVVENEANFVVKVFDLKIEGLGAKSIASWANDNGFSNRTKEWNKKTITGILRNPVFLGQIVFGRRDPVMRRRIDRSEWTIVQAHEPIIDYEVWNMVQQIMDSECNVSLGSPKSTFLFTGLLHCAYCGCKLRIETAKGRRKRYSYYNCSKAQQEGGCENRRVRADDIDTWLVDVISDKIFNKKNLLQVAEELNSTCSSWAIENRKIRRRLASQLQDIEQRNVKIYELFELYGKSCPNLGDLTYRLRHNNKQIKALELELALLESENQPEIHIVDSDLDRLHELLVEIIKTGKPPSKIRRFFASFIKQIRIQDDKAVIDYDPTLLLKQQVVHSEGNWLPERALLGTKRIMVDLPMRFVKAA